MIFEQIRIGGDRNFAYLVGDEHTLEAAVIDVGYNPQMVIDRLRERDLALKYIISTHNHFDHVQGNDELKQATGAPIAMHKSVSGTDVPLDDGDVLQVGSVTLRVLYTPGHTPDSICLLVNNQKLIAGDTLFVGKVGGTGVGNDAAQQYHSLHDKLMTLDDDIEVYPGHDVGVQPNSTIGHERLTNPFLLRENMDAFVDLKRNWADYKREHGIK